MAGLLDFLNTPAGMGLLSGVASYAANARKGAPINNIGRGLAGGLAGYQFAQSDIEAQKQQALQNEFRAMQMDEIKAKRADAEAQKAQMAKFRSELPGMLPPQTPKLSEDQFMQMMPEFEAFGSDAIHDSMKFADQPNPLAKTLANAPDAVLGGVMDKYYGNAMEQLFPKKKEPLKVGKNERVFDPDNYTQIIGAEPEPVDYNRPFLPDGRPNPAYQRYEISKAKAGASNIVNYGQPQPVINPATGKLELVQFPNRPGATPQFTGLEPAPSDKPITGEENKAAGYLGRMQSAEQVINQLSGKGEKTVGTSVAGSIPFIGDYAERKAMTPQQQEYKQAADDWIRAKLRNESGAVIADEEMLREYQTYFPQPGDDASTIRQKAAARKQAEQQMQQAAGRAKPIVDKREAFSLKGQGTFKDPVVINGDDEWANVPKGWYYKGPDGQTRRKQ